MPLMKSKKLKRLPEIPDYNVESHKPLYEFKPSLTGHEWRQQGPYLVCNSCELKHSTYIGMDRLLIGIDAKGKPILEKR